MQTQPSSTKSNWPEDPIGAIDLILAHNILNNSRHFPVDCPSTIPKRVILAKRMEEAEEAAVNLNDSRGLSRIIQNVTFRWKVHQLKLAYDDYSLAKTRASLDGTIPQSDFKWRPGVAEQKIAEDPCDCDNKEKCLGHRRPVLEIREPSNLYIPCREGCLLPAEWMTRKLR